MLRVSVFCARTIFQMLIPSIDLQGGRVVQLVQGDKLAIASDDLDGWIAKFSKFPKVQLIDLDAAMSRGNNDELVKQIAAQLPCRVGGGVRSVRPRRGADRGRRAGGDRRIGLVPADRRTATSRR